MKTIRVCVANFGGCPMNYYRSPGPAFAWSPTSRPPSGDTAEQQVWRSLNASV